MQMTVTVCAFE